MKRYIILVLAMVSPFLLLAESRESTRERYESINAILTYCGDSQLEAAEKVAMAAEEMLSTPYKAGLLDGADGESLIIDLTATDCILMVESVVALVLNATSPYPSYEQFCEYTQKLRYRDGVVGDYSSRLHYTSEWISQGERSGYFKEITQQLGGELREQVFSYMSDNSQSYKALSDEEQLSKIRAIEQRLTSRQGYYVIKKERVSQVLPHLKSGDLVAFTTSIKGLDILHIGVIYIEAGRVTFIHASSKMGEVIINPVDLQEYLGNMKRVDAIRVIRL